MKLAFVFVAYSMTIVSLCFAATIADCDLNQPEKDFEGAHSCPAKSKDVSIRIGTLLSKGSITLEDECEDVEIEISKGSSDLEGLVTIKDKCEGVNIDISDSFDTTGKVVVGKYCKVRIKCGSDFRGTVIVGANSKVKIVTADGGKTDGNVKKEPTAKVTVNGKDR